MKRFVKLIGLLAVLCLVLITPDFSYASSGCRVPERGPPGAQGPQGAQGAQGPQGPPGSTATAYASSFSTVPQVNILGTYPIRFDVEQLPPLGITHPVAGDFTEFQVQNTGVFQIGWTFTALVTEPTSVSVRLFNVTTASVIPPNPFSIDSLLTPGSHSISGETILSLPAGTIIRLEVVVADEPVAILDPTFIITQIAP